MYEFWYDYMKPIYVKWIQIDIAKKTRFDT